MAVVAGVLLIGLVVLELGGRTLIERAATSELRAQGIDAASVTVG